MTIRVFCVVILCYPVEKYEGCISTVFECSNERKGERVHVKRILNNGKATHHGDWDTVNAFIEHEAKVSGAKLAHRYEI